MAAVSTRRLVVWVVFLGLFAMAARFSVDSDTWWHLRAGEWIVQNGAVLQVDPFSYTRYGENWQYPGWLVQSAMYLIYSIFGPGGLNIWTASMVALAFALLWPALSGGPFLRAFTVVLAAAVSGIYWAARPYMVTFVFAAAFLMLLEDYRWRDGSYNPRRLLLLPLLMAVWVNSHGGFAVGFIIFGVYLVDTIYRIVIRRYFPNLLLSQPRLDGSLPLSALTSHKFGLTRKEIWLFAAALLTLAAVLLNPSGPVMLLYPFKTVGIEALQGYIEEWQSPNFHSISVQPFAWLMLLTYGVVGAARMRLALTDFLLFAGFAYMGLLAGRNIALFALAAPLVLTRHADFLLRALSQVSGFRFGIPMGRTSRYKSLLNLTLLALLILVAGAKAAAVYPQAANQVYFEESMPVGAVQYLKQEVPPGRLFNTYNWGGYLVWTLPEYPVFIDGRTDLYNDEIINQWLKVMRAESGWEEILDEWGVRLVLIEPSMPAATALPQAGWTWLYQDDISVLLGKQ
jgi:hypothetical protein